MIVRGLATEVSIVGTEVRITPTLMARCLHPEAVEERIDRAQVSHVEVVVPTPWQEGTLTVRRTDTPAATVVRFGPGQAAAVRSLQAALSTHAVAFPAGTFVAVHVDSDDPDWARCTSVSAVEVTDGEIGTVHVFSPAQLEEFVHLVSDRLLVAHPAFYHGSVLSRALLAAGVTPPSGPLMCSLAVARASALEFDSHELTGIATALGIDPSTDPAVTTAAVYLALTAQAGWERVDAVEANGFVPGRILGSGRMDYVMAARVRPSVEPVRPTRTPRWETVSTPDVVPLANTAADPHGALFGHNVTLTGDFSPLDKGDLWARIAAAGATVGKNVTKKTTLVVLGAWTSMTTKEKRARELIAQGQEITLWTAEHLYRELGIEPDADPKPPF
ncbi:MAG: hypothetical protein SPI77_05955 [Corynebacterium sp.]|nr:hypothetical protein [Corynebacterium sp.]